MAAASLAAPQAAPFAMHQAIQGAQFYQVVAPLAAATAVSSFVPQAVVQQQAPQAVAQSTIRMSSPVPVPTLPAQQTTAMTVIAGQPATTVASTPAEPLHAPAPVPAPAHAHMTAPVPAATPVAPHIYAAPQPQVSVEALTAAPTVVQQAAPTMVHQAASTVVQQLAPTVVQQAAPTVVQQAAPAVVQQSVPVAVAATQAIQPLPQAAQTLPQAVEVVVTAPQAVMAAAPPQAQEPHAAQLSVVGSAAALAAPLPQTAHPLLQMAQPVPQAVEVVATAPQAVMMAAPPQVQAPLVVAAPTVSVSAAYAQPLPPQAQVPVQVETMRVVEAPVARWAAAPASAATCSVCGNTFMDDSNFCRKCGKSRHASAARTAGLENAAAAPAQQGIPSYIAPVSTVAMSYAVPEVEAAPRVVGAAPRAVEAGPRYVAAAPVAAAQVAPTWGMAFHGARLAEPIEGMPSYIAPVMTAPAPAYAEPVMATPIQQPLSYAEPVMSYAQPLAQPLVQDAPAEILRSMGGDWVECLDSQGIFYFNQLTQTSSEVWPPPAQMDGVPSYQPFVQQAAEPGAAQVLRDLGNEWVECLDDQGIFYFNNRTQVSSEVFPSLEPRVLQPASLAQPLVAQPLSAQAYAPSMEPRVVLGMQPSQLEPRVVQPVATVGAPTMMAAPAQAGAESVVKAQHGDWIVAEDAQGLFFFHSPTGQSYEQPPQEIAHLYPIQGQQLSYEPPLVQYQVPSYDVQY